MPKITRSVPSYRLHKASGQAVVTLDGRDHYLGRHGTSESNEEYDRLIAEWLPGRRQETKTDQVDGDVLVNELIDVYMDFVVTYYVKNGKPTGERQAIKYSLRPLSELYGDSVVNKVGPGALRAVREKMIAQNLCRKLINARANRIRRMFKWAVEHEYADPRILEGLRPLLMNENNNVQDVLVVNRGSAKEGSLNLSQAESLLDQCGAITRMESDLSEDHEDPEFWNSLPKEIREGLLTTKADDNTRLKEALKLDEILADDKPEIRLNDRPQDEKATARPVEQLSPGQRCSAILPILLLTGESPIIIDQPEDNLDNRLIRQVIVNILSSMKLRRQVIVATHNPNLPVLGDVESAVILKGVGDCECEVVQKGDLDSPELAHHLTDVMEGGREAFQYRHTIYSSHWDDAVQNPLQNDS